jgi:hypothetical protein
MDNLFRLTIETTLGLVISLICQGQPVYEMPPTNLMPLNRVECVAAVESEYATWYFAFSGTLAGPYLEPPKGAIPSPSIYASEER